MREDRDALAFEVTEAGCARIATRWPSSGLRNSGSASSRSIPNDVMRFA